MSKSISRATLVAVLASTALLGQTPKGPVLGTGSFTSFVENMDRSLAFYHDAFGMDVPALPTSGERPYNAANPQLFLFFDIIGAKERHQSARIAGTRVTLEMMEIQQVPHQTLTLRMQDPGNAAVVFIVRDVDASLARAVAAKAVVATPGGKPIALKEGGRSILIRDIDGRFVELRQPATPPAGTTDILDMSLTITVKNMGETLKFYRDVLGFTVEGEAKRVADAAKLTGLAKAEVTRTRIQGPGSQLWIELDEYKGVDSKPLQLKIQDRGAARLQLRVSDTDVVAAAVKAGGGKIMSTDGKPQPIPPNLKGVLVADPNNFLLTPYAPCDGCAPGIGVAPKQTK